MVCVREGPAERATGKVCAQATVAGARQPNETYLILSVALPRPFLSGQPCPVVVRRLPHHS